MKLDPNSVHQNGDGPARSAAVEAVVPNRFRLLKWNELVRQGDFTADLHGGFELWEGPTGFRADAFVKPIYRRVKSQPAAAGKLS